MDSGAFQRIRNILVVPLHFNNETKLKINPTLTREQKGLLFDL